MTAPLPDRVGVHGRRTAIVDPAGSWTFATIDDDAVHLAGALPVAHGDRVAVLCTAGHDIVVAMLACWHAGAIAVPLHPPNPDTELAYVLADSGAAAIVASPAHRDAADRLAAAAGIPVVDAGASGLVHRFSPGLDRPALMIYTSGTTGRPKGAVHTHGSLAAMVDGMLRAWAWSASDRTVLVLPLNHVHGLVNVTLTPLAVGACCEAPGSFDAVAVWERLASGEVTVFMAVPTIYARLTAAWEAAADVDRDRWSNGASGLRLMVSGSAALPVSTLDRWRQLTGHTLLERYGMTELGMVLSNTLTSRVPGHVGEPMPGVELRLVDDAGAAVPPGAAGELLVRGPQVFAGYWERPDATAESFVDGWFRTGDVAVHEPDGYRLLGRSSVDIIKTGGEKVSALEIEEVYRTHPGIADCAVVGLEDPEWGQRVAIAAVAAAGSALDGDALRAWGKQQLAAAKVPSRFVFVDDLPRNTLGKVVKPEVAKLFT
ncbi:MAG TPA: acyl-CoA synthetase [Ilumatobacteraceae bacterium]|nr:acyl-CoA synthetase [Ilumatobacteraceae bacterium]